MNITAKSDSGETVTVLQHKNGWVRPAKWLDSDTLAGSRANRKEEEDRYTDDPDEAQRWANAMARRCK